MLGSARVARRAGPQKPPPAPPPPPPELPPPKLLLLPPPLPPPPPLEAGGLPMLESAAVIDEKSGTTPLEKRPAVVARADEPLMCEPPDGPVASQTGKYVRVGEAAPVRTSSSDRSSTSSTSSDSPSAYDQSTAWSGVSTQGSAWLATTWSIVRACSSVFWRVRR